MSTRTLVSPASLARPRGKAVYWTVFAGVVVLFALAFLFPVYWMVTGAAKSPDEVARTPPTLVPPPETGSPRAPHSSAWSARSPPPPGP